MISPDEKHLLLKMSVKPTMMMMVLLGLLLGMAEAPRSGDRVWGPFEELVVEALDSIADAVQNPMPVKFTRLASVLAILTIFGPIASSPTIPMRPGFGW